MARKAPGTSERYLEKHEVYLKNREHIRKRNEEWRQNNRAHVREYSRKYDSKQKAGMNARYGSLVSRSPKRGIEVGITFDQYSDLVTGAVCHYCEGDLPATGAGLDRVDNSKGYTMDNVVTCCVTCNLAKRELSQEEFKAWIIRVHTRWAVV